MPLVVRQGSLQGVTFGDGTNYRWDEEGPSGVGGLEPKTILVDLKGGDGSYAGPARKPSRLITIPFMVVGTSESDVMDNFETLAAAFDDPGSNQTLELYLPGKHFSVSGRPWGCPEDSLAQQKQGIILCTGSFMAASPTMTAL